MKNSFFGGSTIPALALAGLVFLFASPALAQPEQPPELRTYALKSNGAKKHVVALEAIYKPAATLKIIAIDDKQIIVYAPPKIQEEIREKLKTDLLSDKGKKLSDALDAKKKQIKDGKNETSLTLEDALAKALKQNPDILVALAKVGETDAELSRERALAEAKLQSAKADFESTEAILKESMAKFERLKQLRAGAGSKVVTDEELGAAEAIVVKFKGERARSEAAVRAASEKGDILVAEAKLRLVEAELNRTKHDVTAKVTTAFADIEGARAILKQAQTQLARLSALRDKGVVSEEEIGVAQATFANYKADLEKKEAVLPYLIGKDLPPDSQPTATWPFYSPSPPYSTSSTNKKTGLGTTASALANTAKAADINPPNADKLRKTLAVSVWVNKLGSTADAKVNLNEALSVLQFYVQDQKGGVNILPSANGNVGETIMPGLYLDNPVTLAAALQMIEDSTTIRFVIRDYGIVGMDAKNIPPGALLVSDFMKHSQDKEAKKAPK